LKKFSIFFFLSLVLTGYASGDIAITGEFGFSNIGTDDGGTGPYLKYTADGSAETFIGPGRIGAAVELQFIVDLLDATSRGNKPGDSFIAAHYAISLGPGELKFTLLQSTDFYLWNLEPALDYGGIGLGSASLGFGIWYNHRFNRNTGTAGQDSAPGGSAASFRASEAIPRHPHPPGYDSEADSGADSGGGIISGPSAGGAQYSDKFGFNISADFSFGLGILYGLSCGINKNAPGGAILGITKIAHLDISYYITNQLKAGLELDDTGKDFRGFTLNPYFMFNVSRFTDLGFNLYIRKINPAAAGIDIEINPSFWARYTF
jgi:hypothetical protein